MILSLILWNRLQSMNGASSHTCTTCNVAGLTITSLQLREEDQQHQQTEHLLWSVVLAMPMPVNDLVVIGMEVAECGSLIPFSLSQRPRCVIVHATSLLYQWPTAHLRNITPDGVLKPETASLPLCPSPVYTCIYTCAQC